MLNILTYIGMNLQSEVCLWTLLGILRTIFDATLFKVNANLKQVWHMKMPEELSLSVQRVLRTMISGVMLVQCFTVYVYLASYIVLLYPVFLEERPTLVLPWLLLAAVRNFLCELTSLALGLGTCVLLGPARPPCIKFVIVKLASIMPAFYMWMLIFSYYHYLKMASAFKTFPAVSPSKKLDYGLELAIRRRRTKSLQGEDQLRKNLASFYEDQTTLDERGEKSVVKIGKIIKNTPNSSIDEITLGIDDLCPLPLSVTSNRTMSEIGTYEDWFGSEVVLPRDTDRILEQFVLMLLRIGVFIKKENVDPVKLMSNSQTFLSQRSKIECPTISTEETETPPLVGSSKGAVASYLRDYPQIFMKKPSDLFMFNTPESLLKNNCTQNESNESSHSKDATKKDSSDTISLVEENRSLFLNSTKKSSDSLIHSKEEIGKYVKKPEKQLKHISTETITASSNNLKLDTKESIESVVNRMKVRVAANNDVSLEDEKENRVRDLILNRIKSHASNKSSNSTNEQERNTLDLKKGTNKVKKQKHNKGSDPKKK